MKKKKKKKKKSKSVNASQWHYNTHKQKNGDGLPLTLEIGANVSMPSIHSFIYPFAIVIKFEFFNTIQIEFIPHNIVLNH
ncbi:hypothetical protein BLOT_009373 [Blomia tropicalis]|nr:hypothetical protein BLOT_009373 [Blomia tropicalis]